MSIGLIFGVVILQIMVFQIGLAKYTRALTSFAVGPADLPEPAASRLRGYEKSARTVNGLLAGLLVLAACILTFLLPIGLGGRKLALAIVSISSSLIFAGGLLIGRRAMTRVSSLVPGSGVRSASLAPRSLGQHYPVLWELVPVLVFLATVAITLPAIPDAGNGGETLGLWLMPLFQAAFIVLTYLLSYRLATRYNAIPQEQRALLDSPAKAVALDQALRMLKLRALMAIKILVALQVALIQLRRVQELMSGEAQAWVRPAVWAVTAIMLVYLVWFMKKAKDVRAQPLKT